MANIHAAPYPIYPISKISLSLVAAPSSSIKRPVLSFFLPSFRSSVRPTVAILDAATPRRRQVCSHQEQSDRSTKGLLTMLVDPIKSPSPKETEGWDRMRSRYKPPWMSPPHPFSTGKQLPQFNFSSSLLQPNCPSHHDKSRRLQLHSFIHSFIHYIHYQHNK